MESIIFKFKSASTKASWWKKDIDGHDDDDDHPDNDCAPAASVCIEGVGGGNGPDHDYAPAAGMSTLDIAIASMRTTTTATMRKMIMHACIFFSQCM